jgi:FixJ family two-component response regulator
MERVTEGKPNKVIATELGIGEKTVEVHALSLFADFFAAESGDEADVGRMLQGLVALGVAAGLHAPVPVNKSPVS